MSQKVRLDAAFGASGMDEGETVQIMFNRHGNCASNRAFGTLPAHGQVHDGGDR